MTPDLHAVAAYARVSVSTVSRVLGNRGTVAAATRKRVQEALDAVGYSRSTLLAPAARRLVAVCAPADPEHWQMEVCSRVAATLQREGLDTAMPAISTDISEVVDCVAAGAIAVISPTFTPIAVDVPVIRFAEAGSDAGAAGVGVQTAGLSAHGGHDRKLARERIAARIDLTGALNLAFDHLGALGHRRIGLICNDSGELSHLLREHFVAEHPMRGLGLDTGGFIARVPKSFAGGIDALLHLKDRACTAVVVQSALQLYGVLAAVQRRRLVVPRDMSVLGLGDSLTVRFTNPAASVLGFNNEDMSRAIVAATRTALHLSGEPMKAVPPTFRAQLIARRSTAGPVR